VIVGFTTGAAFLIVATQFSSLLGVSKCETTVFGTVDVSHVRLLLQEAQQALVNGSTNITDAQQALSQTMDSLPDAKTSCAFYDDVIHVFSHLDEVRGWLLFTAVLCVVWLVMFKDLIRPRLPPSWRVLANMGPLLLMVILLPIGMSQEEALESVGIKVMGPIAEGLPPFRNIFQRLTFGDFVALIPATISIAAIGYMEAMTIAKTVARKHGGYALDPSQEMTALGVSNLLCSQFSGFPVTGSFSRTAVNADSGAASALSALVSAVLVGLACVLLTQVLRYLPSVVLGSIILVAAVNLVEIEQAVFFFRSSIRDFVVFLVVFVLVLVMGVQPALVAGILLHWLFALTLPTGVQTPVGVAGFVSPPSMTAAAAPPKLMDLYDTRYLVTRSVLERAQQHRICVLPFRSDLTFASGEMLRSVCREVLEQYGPRFLILDCQGVNGVDVSGAEALRGVAMEADKLQSTVLVAGLGATPGRSLERTLRAHDEMEHWRLCACLDPLWKCCRRKETVSRGNSEAAVEVVGAAPSQALVRMESAVMDLPLEAELDDRWGVHRALEAAGLAKIHGGVILCESVFAGVRHAIHVGNDLIRGKLARKIELAASSRDSHIGVPPSPMQGQPRKRASVVSKKPIRWAAAPIPAVEDKSAPTDSSSTTHLVSMTELLGDSWLASVGSASP
jgi:MFS superfamily sulfate permease-like transporter